LIFACTLLAHLAAVAVAATAGEESTNEGCELETHLEPTELRQLQDREFAKGLPFRVFVNDLEMKVPLLLHPLLPTEQLEIRAEGEANAEFEASAASGDLEQIKPGNWIWKPSPEPGACTIEITSSTETGTAYVHAFVKRPWNGDAKLNKFEIGKYQASSDKPDRTIPKGFIEVTEENRDAFVSPNFQLGEFTSNQPSDFPKYVLIDPRLLIRLELLVDTAKEYGIDPEAIRLLSGYRTPHHNRKLGNKTTFSHHLYGLAADVYVDADGDFETDDLNRDGERNAWDIVFLYGIAEEARGLAEKKGGGLGFYAPASHRPGFVHIDIREYPVAW